MEWDVEYACEFSDKWAELSEEARVLVATSVTLHEERGLNLGIAPSSSINGSRHSHMRKLSTQH